jgi:hypothetical protein
MATGLKGRFSIVKISQVGQIVLSSVTVCICAFADETYAQAPSTPPLSRLEILSGGYPKAFLFWTTTRPLVAASTGRIPAGFPALQGVASPSDQWEEFSEFKAAHPDKLVYLFTQGQVFSEFPSQYNPNDRREFFAGHWVHFEGCRVMSDIPAEAGETEIVVEDPDRFRMIVPDRARGPAKDNLQTAGKQPLIDDVALCRLDEHGRPDWNAVEQVRLAAVDADRKTLRICRGMYGTEPLAFTANQTWAAAHAYRTWGSGTWPNITPSWLVNYSPHCPRDAKGRTAADILIEQFGALFDPGGRFHLYDGLEFDAIVMSPHSEASHGRGFDTDGDGMADGGCRDGVNVYGIGFHDFARRLRERLDPGKLILGDAIPKIHGQRFFGVFNGIESEWWPQWTDADVSYWSSGVNLHEFWKQNAHPPYFSYFVHKIGGQDRKAWNATPYRIHRLVMAAAQFVDAAITTFHPIGDGLGETVAIFDELRAGSEKKAGWLGRPLGPAVAMAARQEDLLGGTGQRMELPFVRRFAETKCRVQSDRGSVRVSGDAGSGHLKFSLVDLPCRGEDLFVRFLVRAAPRQGYPEDYARHVSASLSAASPREATTFANSRDFEAGFYFREVKGSKARLRFEMEGNEPVWISDLTVHAFPDVRYRRFEHGLVLANPSDRPFTFDLDALAPGVRFACLPGTKGQDPIANSGRPVGGSVTLERRDGLFLRAESAAAARTMR